MARAFNYAGVESVVASLWGVSDEASRKIILLYYGNLKKNVPKDVALQQAQMEFLQNDNISSPAFRQPAHWAAWVILGDQGPVPIWERPLATYLAYLGLVLFGGWLLAKGIKSLRP